MVRWGFIGCGKVLENKSGAAFFDIENILVNAVMCPNEDKVKSFAKSFGIPYYFTDIQQMIASNLIDAVYIATPPNSHLHYTKLALQNDLAVYVEKPMARTYTECQEMLQTAKENNRPLYVAYYRRFQPYFLKVKSLLDSGELGEILSVEISLQKPIKDIDRDSSNWRLNKEVSGGGYVYDVACHHLDLLLWFFKNVDLVHSISQNRNGLYEVEDYVAAHFFVANGIPVSANWSFISPQGESSEDFRIIGTRAELQFSVLKNSPIQLIRKDQTFSFEFPRDNIAQYEMIKFVNSQIQSNICDFRGTIDAAQVNLILDIITKKVVYP